jgi:AcrR family transcriptional regulator
VTADDESTDPSLEDGVSWREFAVARSLDSARTRAESRVQRFMDAALELVNRDSGTDFTVQEVVERSGQSLRTFYQYFDGKHELLLALFEESIASTVEYLSRRLAEEQGSLDRLHCFVIEYYKLCRPSAGGKPTAKGAPPVMAEFAWQLLTKYPREASRAFDPIESMLTELLDDAARGGALRADLRSGRVTGVMLEAIMFNVFASTIGGAPSRSDKSTPAEDLWDLLFRGMGARTGS